MTREIRCEHCLSDNVNYEWEDENEDWKRVEVYECEECWEITYIDVSDYYKSNNENINI